VDAILPLVIAINQDHMRRPTLRNHKSVTLLKNFGETLDLLAAILPEDARKWTNGMGDVLRHIGLANPSLLNDVRLSTLKSNFECTMSFALFEITAAACSLRGNERRVVFIRHPCVYRKPYPSDDVIGIT